MNATTKAEYLAELIAKIKEVENLMDERFKAGEEFSYEEQLAGEAICTARTKISAAIRNLAK